MRTYKVKRRVDGVQGYPKSSSGMTVAGDYELGHPEESTQMTQELKVITTEIVTHSFGPVL